MQYTSSYQSPLGEILLACDDIGLTGLWFDQAKYYALNLDTDNQAKETPVIQATKRWLDIYFKGQEPDFMPPIHMIGTAFQLSVWEILKTIPYGQTMTYGDIATLIAKKRGMQSMSAQAVGHAVGHNALSIIIPCHRVLGTHGNLTGYAGGIERKLALLTLEGIPAHTLSKPKKGTAL